MRLVMTPDRMVIDPLWHNPACGGVYRQRSPRQAGSAAAILLLGTWPGVRWSGATGERSWVTRGSCLAARLMVPSEVLCPPRVRHAKERRAAEIDAHGRSTDEALGIVIGGVGLFTFLSLLSWSSAAPAGVPPHRRRTGEWSGIGLASTLVSALEGGAFLLVGLLGQAAYLWCTHAARIVPGY